MTCGAIQKGADTRIFFPDECGSIQTVTLATSDPCQCKLYSGGDCPDPGFTNNQKCNLCDGNKRIGDPHMVVKSGILAGMECIDAFDVNKFGAFEKVCSAATMLIQKWCSCVAPGEAVKQCIPQEDKRYPCNRNDPTDTCCEGQCRFRSTFRDYVCTNKVAQEPHPTIFPPSKNPNPAPNKVPSPLLRPSTSSPAYPRVPTWSVVSGGSPASKKPNSAPTKVPSSLARTPSSSPIRAQTPTKAGVSGKSALSKSPNTTPSMSLSSLGQPSSSPTRAPIPTKAGALGIH
jgi:hypothetical protein